MCYREREREREREMGSKNETRNAVAFADKSFCLRWAQVEEWCSTYLKDLVSKPTCGHIFFFPQLHFSDIAPTVSIVHRQIQKFKLTRLSI